MVNKLICITVCAFSKERWSTSLWRGKRTSQKLLKCQANPWTPLIHLMKNNIQVIKCLLTIKKKPSLVMKSQCLRKQLITVSVNSFHQATDRSWEEPFSNHPITDIAVESFIYTWSDRGKMFGLSSPSPPRKAVEYLEVPTCEVAVCKSHQMKPFPTWFCSYFQYTCSKMFCCDKLLDLLWILSTWTLAQICMHLFVHQ